MASSKLTQPRCTFVGNDCPAREIRRLRKCGERIYSPTAVVFAALKHDGGGTDVSVNLVTQTQTSDRGDHAI